ncbi:TAXI family TRAP transporter solute-binding subunit [Phaeobacter gallaeciensis]|uniref:TAXI family TRAP transporter solute-binding subunit n=1 Tax=Phaeobacter gallaeciensis TaxID=60890 RepID=UPI00237F3C30|nr:TAXI family TRAP transporter solute-binding subunit [Phaeobacter gallaeciensis]MDE4063438.1 TAXI family TRAP transporter solute-binding subunit [Phaeobacter gallaeciensis]MDE4126444.1 TAXI family TRAP transporter solute-binding subunit [Phaeobacter gallaeciensis]MDE4130936.1 TAXI family TRAP transporter solute-binding subunit [Phaeobacter gallaeciensis]
MKHTLAALLGATLLASPLAAQDKDLLIGSTSASSSHYGYFVAVGQLINENVEGLKASVVETGATLDNIRRMARGQIDLGLVTTNAVQHAVAGTNAFEGNPQDLRLLWVYTNAPQNVIVRADAGVDSLYDLADTRFNPGIKGGSTEATTEAVFKALGLVADYVRGSTTDIVGAIKDNRVAGYVKSGSGLKLDGSTMDIAVATDIKVLGLSPEQADKLRAEMPDISVVDIPLGAAEGIPAYSTWAFGVGVAAPSSMDEDTAYQIVAAIMADDSAQANAMASLKGADLAQMTLDYGTVQLHPGALRWFEEQGMEIPAKLKAD